MPISESGCDCCFPTKTGKLVVTTIPGGRRAIRAKPKRESKDKPKPEPPAPLGKTICVHLTALEDGSTSVTTDAGVTINVRPNRDCDRAIGMLLNDVCDHDTDVELFVNGISVTKKEDIGYLMLSDYVLLFEAIRAVGAATPTQ